MGNKDSVHYVLCFGAVCVPSIVLGAAPKVPLPVALAKRILAECGAKTWLRQLLVCTAGHAAVCPGRMCQESSVTLEMSGSGSCDTCSGVGTALCSLLLPQMQEHVHWLD